MSESITQIRAEDAVAHTDAFLNTERGVVIDGNFAGKQIAERVGSMQNRAENLLESVVYPKLNGLYVPLSQNNANRYSEAVAVLPGYMVLVPSALVSTGTSVFYPAVVSEDGLASGVLRLHVLKQPYRNQVRYGTSVVLSAAGQSETSGIGDHGRTTNDGVEAEHFATLLAVGSDRALQAAWRSGHHVNHAWRKHTGNSVIAEVSKRLFDQEMPQTTITITQQQIETGAAMVLWHKGMRDEQTGKPETAARDKALVVMQALGYEALRNRNPQGIDTIRRLLA